jgi:hypothetical protein
MVIRSSLIAKEEGQSTDDQRYREDHLYYETRTHKRSEGLTEATRERGMTAPHLKEKFADETATPIKVSMAPKRAFTITAVLIPNAAQDASVARPIATVVI